MTQNQIKSLKICRTCFHPIKSGKYAQLQDICSVPEPETIEEMLTTVVPEIDLNSVVNPVICKSCLVMLQTSYRFRKICVANETRLVEQMQILSMRTVKLNYVGDDGEMSDPIVKREQEADFETETNTEALYPTSLCTVKNVDDIKHYCKESGFDASIEIIEIKTEKDYLHQAEMLQENETKVADSAEGYFVVVPLNETHTETALETTISGCNINDHNEPSGKTILREFTEEEDDQSNNVCEELKAPSCVTKNLDANTEIQQNSEPNRGRRQKKFLYSTSSYIKRNKNKQLQLKCEACEITFNKSYIYCEHMMVTHNMTFPKCEMCDKYFHNAHLLKRHMCRHLRAKNHKSIKDFLCDVCGKHFMNYSSFRSHQLTHNKSDRLKCDICGNTFKGKYGLLLHKQTHTSLKEFMCEVCGVQLKSRSTFQRHRSKHLGTYIKKQRCPVCDKRFENPSRLRLHLLTHNGAKPHTCELCNRGFTLLQNLKRHLRKHTGEKPYFCNVCERRFTRITGLKEHHCGLKKQKDVIVPTLQCNVCSRLFKFQGTLERHKIRAHSDNKMKKNPLACEICGRIFTHPANRKRHQLTHTEEKRFTCEICKKSFRTKYESMIHTRRHTGEKPFKCQFCDMCFVDSGEKGRHERKHLHGGSSRRKRNK